MLRSHTAEGHSASPQGERIYFFYVLRYYVLPIVLMWYIIIETALKICVFDLCFITSRISPNSFSSTGSSLKYTLASFMSS